MLSKVGILGALLIVTSVQAQISPVSRVSRVYGWEHMIDLGHNDLGTVSSEQIGTDFGLFDRSVGAGGYTATQRSEIGFGPDVGVPFVSVSASAYGNPRSAFGYGGAESSMTFVFDIGEPGQFWLEGSTSQFIGIGSVSLTGPGIDILATSDSLTPVYFAFQGEMDTGRYTLAVMTTADFGSVQALFNFVPAPGAMGLAGAGLVAILRRPRR